MKTKTSTSKGNLKNIILINKKSCNFDSALLNLGIKVIPLKNEETHK
jgi:hypothetical protein